MLASRLLFITGMGVPMSQSFRFLGSSVLSITVLLMGLMGCGGSGKTVSEGALGACTPSEGAVGSIVVCEAGAIADDCTVFFGNTPGRTLAPWSSTGTWVTRTTRGAPA